MKNTIFLCCETCPFPSFDIQYQIVYQRQEAKLGCGYVANLKVLYCLKCVSWGSFVVYCTHYRKTAFHYDICDLCFLLLFLNQLCNHQIYQCPVYFNNLVPGLSDLVSQSILTRRRLILQIFFCVLRHELQHFFRQRLVKTKRMSLDKLDSCQATSGKK